MAESGWLDPPAPHSAHTEVECYRALPAARAVDVGRRFRCPACGRAYRVGTDQREGAGWVRHAVDDVDMPPRSVTGCQCQRCR